MADTDPPRRYALLLIGLIGNLHKRASRADQDRIQKQKVTSEVASPRIIRYATSTHRALVLDANEHIGGVDVFAHTWNPLAGAYFDEQFGDRMRLSAHEPAEYHASGRSHALSIGRGGQLVRAFERMHNHSYATVLVLRADLFLKRAVDLRLIEATGSDGGELLYFASQCCTDAPSSPAEVAALDSQCGAGHAGGGLFKRGCSGAHYTHTLRPPPIDVAYFLYDWWLAGRARTVASWALIAEQWELYSCSLMSLAHHKGPSSKWSHFRWPVHVHDALNLTSRMRFTGVVGGDMARSAYAGAHPPPERLPPGCAEALAAAHGTAGVGSAEDDLLSLPGTGPGGRRVASRYGLRALERTPLDVHAPHADRVLAQIGLDRRFASMARVCPWTELSVRRALLGEAGPLAHCSAFQQPPGLAPGALTRACRLPDPPAGLRGAQNPEVRQRLDKLPDNPLSSWRSAPPSLAAARGRFVLDEIRRWPRGQPGADAALREQDPRVRSLSRAELALTADELRGDHQAHVRRLAATFKCAAQQTRRR